MAIAWIIDVVFEVRLISIAVAIIAAGLMFFISSIIIMRKKQPPKIPKDLKDYQPYPKGGDDT